MVEADTKYGLGHVSIQWDRDHSNTITGLNDPTINPHFRSRYTIAKQFKPQRKSKNRGYDLWIKTTHAVIATMLIVSLTAGGAVADPAPAGPKFLSPADYDPATLLPPPPAEGSAEAAAELAELHRIEAARTSAQFAAANTDEVTEDASIFAGVFGPGFDLAKLPATAAMLKDLRADEKLAAKAAKDYFLRTRPWIIDSTLHPCATDDPPKSAYPSGHTTHGFAMAVVLAHAAPEKAQALLARAKAYGENRLVCGMHFRADIVAGQTLGVVVGLKLLDKPRFREEVDLARSELLASKLARP